MSIVETSESAALVNNSVPENSNQQPQVRLCMSPVDYKRERETIRATYGDNKAQAGVRFEQALAQLFYRSGWTQEQLATEEGKSQPYITRMLQFGRFLNFMPSGHNPEKDQFSKLSERKFRDYWARTEPGGNERIRFLAVNRLIEEAHLSAQPRPGIVAAIKKRFADGKWHRVETIARAVEAPDDQVEHILGKCCHSGGYSLTQAERRKSGKHNEYRIFRRERTVSTEEIVSKISPIIEHLEEQSKRAAGTISGATIAMLATQLANLLKHWVE